MGRIMQALPSFLTPPKSGPKHQNNVDVHNIDDDDVSPPESRSGLPPSSMSARERRRAQAGWNNNPERRNSRSQPPSAFVMPYERERPSSSSVPLDRPKSPPPGYNRPGDATRRQTWGAPGSRAGEDHMVPAPRINDTVPAESQLALRSVDNYKTALKEWKKHHNVFMSGFQEIYLPALERCFTKISPQLEAALQPLCGPQELRICIQHWQQETRKFSVAGLTCANAVKGLVRNAWNEVVVIDEQAADGQTLMNKLRIDMDNAYDVYLKALESSKENLWHTLDFNIDNNQDLKYEVRESFWGLFDKLQITKEEHACGLFILSTPDLESSGGRRGEVAPARQR